VLSSPRQQVLDEEVERELLKIEKSFTR
jgi:hypothetical protein